MAGTFPRFAPLNTIDPAAYARALAGHLPYSSFNYVSLRCYWPEAQVALAENGVALILPPPANENEAVVTALLRGANAPLLAQLTDYARATGIASALRQVPACTLTNLPAGYQVTECPESFDYILAIAGMLDPQTADLRKKHQQVRDYRAANPGVRVSEVELTSAEVRAALIEIDRAWHTRRNKNGNGNGNPTSGWEQQAFLRCIAQHADFSLHVLIAHADDGTALGFTINENLGNGCYMAHFGKTLPGHAGLSELLELETAGGCRPAVAAG
jgi:hypothetical protein